MSEPEVVKKKVVLIYMGRRMVRGKLASLYMLESSGAEYVLAKPLRTGHTKAVVIGAAYDAEMVVRDGKTVVSGDLVYTGRKVVRDLVVKWVAEDMAAYDAKQSEAVNNSRADYLHVLAPIKRAYASADMRTRNLILAAVINEITRA